MKQLLRRIAQRWRKAKSTSRKTDKDKNVASKHYPHSAAPATKCALTPSASAVSSERTMGSRTRPLSASMDTCMRNALLGPISPMASTTDLVDAIPAAWNDIVKRMNREQILPSSSIGIGRSQPFGMYSASSQDLIKASLGPMSRSIERATAATTPSSVILHHRSRWSRIESQPDLRSVYLHDSLLSGHDNVGNDNVSLAGPFASLRASTPSDPQGAADRNTPNRDTFGDQQFDSNAGVKQRHLPQYSSSCRLFSSSPFAECHGTAEEFRSDWPDDDFHGHVCDAIAQSYRAESAPHTPRVSISATRPKIDAVSSTESSSSVLVLQRIDEGTDQPHDVDAMFYKGRHGPNDDDVFDSKNRERRYGVDFGRFDEDYRLSPPKFLSEPAVDNEEDMSSDDYLVDMLSSPTAQARRQDEYIAKLKRWLRKTDHHETDSAHSNLSEARASSELETEPRESMVMSEPSRPTSKRCSWRNSKRLSELLDISPSLIRSGFVTTSDGTLAADATASTLKTAASRSRISTHSPARSSRTTAAIDALLEQVRSMRAPPPQASSPVPRPSN